jgi:hypothetical protein
MKKIFVLIIAIIGITNVSKAQLEVTTNPIGILFGAYTLSADYNINEDFSFGVEGAFINEESEPSFFYINAKHYFFPTERGSNGIYIGLFAGQASYNNINIFDSNFNKREMQIGAGFLAGYKITSRKNIIIDLGAGLGKGFGNDTFLNVLPYLKANIGYRFNVKTKDVPEKLN